MSNLSFIFFKINFVKESVEDQNINGLIYNGDNIDINQSTKRYYWRSIIQVIRKIPIFRPTAPARSEKKPILYKDVRKINFP